MIISKHHITKCEFQSLKFVVLTVLHDTLLTETIFNTLLQTAQIYLFLSMQK